MQLLQLQKESLNFCTGFDQVSILVRNQQQFRSRRIVFTHFSQMITWKPHISLLASKLSKSIGIIHKSRFFLSTQSLRTLHSSMILPYLYYCNLASGGTYKANLQRIVILQKRALRILNNSTYDANISFMISSRFN